MATTMVEEEDLTQEVPHTDDDRMDVPGVIEAYLLMGTVQHARDEQLLKHCQVAYLLDVENPRKRDAQAVAAHTVDPAIDMGRVELDDDYSYDTFKTSIHTANTLIQHARADSKTVFVFCTHGNNESAVVCMAYLMVIEQWSLERAYRHVLQRRPASAPRKAYVEKLRMLELEVRGKVSLRSEQVGPSMIDIMMGLQGQSATSGDDSLVRASIATDGVESSIERASMMSNMSVVTGFHNGSSMRETMIIAEKEEQDELVHPQVSNAHKRTKSRATKGSCVIS